MILNMNGGGGAVLNFKVGSYDSEEALLAATPSENTIGIITTTPVTSWIFSAAEPVVFENGMVWIVTGTYCDTEFNALKKNGIQVYPLHAKQYISGAWVDVTAMSYQDGHWSEIFQASYLYKIGDECTDITGGYVSKALASNVDIKETGGAPTVTRYDTYLHIAQNGSRKSGTVHISNKIDLTEYDELVFEGIMSGGDKEKCCMVIWSNLGTYGEDNRVAYTGSSGGFNDTEVVKTLDISSLSGSYVIGFNLFSNTGGPYAYIKLKKLYLRRGGSHANSLY